MADNDLPQADAELYLERFYHHMERGDDAMNARLRIIEEGCPVELAEKIEAAAFPDGEEE